MYFSILLKYCPITLSPHYERNPYIQPLTETVQVVLYYRRKIITHAIKHMFCVIFDISYTNFYIWVDIESCTWYSVLSVVHDGINYYNLKRKIHKMSNKHLNNTSVTLENLTGSSSVPVIQIGFLDFGLFPEAPEF